MLPGDPTMGELPFEMPARMDVGGPEPELIDIGVMSHSELMDMSAGSRDADLLADLFSHPPGVAPGRQAYITGLPFIASG